METNTRNVTLVLVSGGTVSLSDPFIMGDGIAGDVAGVTRWFADADILSVNRV